MVWNVHLTGHLWARHNTSDLKSGHGKARNSLAYLLICLTAASVLYLASFADTRIDVSAGSLTAYHRATYRAKHPSLLCGSVSVCPLTLLRSFVTLMQLVRSVHPPDALKLKGLSLAPL
jgi:hypothetical protein